MTWIPGRSFPIPAGRQKLIGGLVEEALSLGADGINVDFEQVPEDAGEDYIEFLRELSIPCRANGLVLSVDNYVPRNYNSHYHWKEQGAVADYVIVMGYDEHYGGSQETGSVASIGYVEEGISTMVQYVPAEKVINAVPFYTRIWETGAEGVKSQAVGMTDGGGLPCAARESSRYGTRRPARTTRSLRRTAPFFQVWLEDEQSLRAKLQVMEQYGIGGAAAWKLGYEAGHPEAWDGDLGLCGRLRKDGTETARLLKLGTHRDGIRVCPRSYTYKETDRTRGLHEDGIKGRIAEGGGDGSCAERRFLVGRAGGRSGERRPGGAAGKGRPSAW